MEDKPIAQFKIETKTTNGKLLLQGKEAAAMLSIHRNTLRNYVKAGKLPAPIKIGCSMRWRASDLRSYVDALASQPTTS